ncbi:hypothetical protein LUZ61_017419 [Rhynchospora tenuis]|uniref:KIB1-4 beta-propeller domain-containing protein n=1 Tax=Rhynchospora tenuis TaxID=198213 RepID=A0AAD5Z7E7_9POAL|nr:hypothetical protein LUZ61_017419 [Rhynchospora tenuis]
MALQPTLRRLKNQTLSNKDISRETDWSDLQPELIYLISRKLTDIFDFVRFRIVCKGWRHAVGVSDLPPQLPWIMVKYWKFRDCYLHFYSLLTGKTYTINVDQYYKSDHNPMEGSAYNYIPTCNWETHECPLFNPLTNEKLSLPRTLIWSLSCVPSVQLLSASDHSSRYVCMTNPPSEDFTCLYSCHLGDLNWTAIQPRSSVETGTGFVNAGFALYDGMCYANDEETGGTKVINLATRTVVCVVPWPETDQLQVRICLLVSSGDILRVCHYHKYETKKPCYFHIYRLELGKGDGNMMHPCWIKIDKINNQFPFLHEDHGCAFRADDFPGFVGNSIYFLRWKAGEGTQINRYDIKDGKIEVLEVPLKLGHTWFVPSLCKQSSNFRS